jgi:hypothetical protein
MLENDKWSSLFCLRVSDKEENGITTTTRLFGKKEIRGLNMKSS